MANYSYPLDLDWTHQEISTVISLWNAVEDAYERGIETELFIKRYKDFKTIVKSIGEEKRLGKEFESVSGYSLYRVVQMSKNASKRIKMEQ